MSVLFCSSVLDSRVGTGGPGSAVSWRRAVCTVMADFKLLCPVGFCTHRKVICEADQLDSEPIAENTGIFVFENVEDNPGCEVFLCFSTGEGDTWIPAENFTVRVLKQFHFYHSVMGFLKTFCIIL